MENFPKQSVFTPEKWNLIIMVFSMLKKDGRDTNSILTNEVYNGILVGQLLEEIRLLRASGKLTEQEVKTLQNLKVRVDFRKYRWMYMYNKAKDYYKLHGNLQVKRTEDYELQHWIRDQRRKYLESDRVRPNGKIDKFSRHTDEQRQLLEEIGIVWDVSSFNKYYPLLLKFHNMWPDKEVPNPCWIDGVELYHWVYSIQSGRGKVTDEQRELLLKINFNFKTERKERYNSGTSFPEQVVLFYFRKVFEDSEERIKVGGFELDMYSKKQCVAIEYDGYMWHKSKGALHTDNRKDDYCRENGIKLIRIREDGLPKTDSAVNYFVPKNVELLDQPLKDIFKKEFGVSDISIDIKRDCIEIQDYYLNLESVAINRHIKDLVDYVNEHHSFPPSNKKHSGLYGVVLLLRELKKGRRGRLTDKQIATLDRIGMIWKPNEYNWEVGYSHAKEYYKVNGTLDVPLNYLSPDKYNLGQWIFNQRCRKSPEKKYRGKLLTQEQITRLESIGMIW